MGDMKNPKLAIPVVLIAGIFWSFGPYVVRNIDDAHMVPWQYLFTRGLVIFILLNVYLFMEEGLSFLSNYKKIGISGVVGGLGLAIAMITFIWSITNTTAAITLLCLAAMPFITALLGFLFLKETISTNVWVAIVIAAIGIVIMAIGNHEKNTFLGFILGITSAIGFSVFSVSLRWRKETPKFTTVAIAGAICVIVSLIVIINKDLSLISSSKNQTLFALH